MNESETICPDTDTIMPMVDRIYTVEEAAEVLKIKPRTLKKWIGEGKITAFRLGGAKELRIHEEDLQAFITRERATRSTRGDRP